MFFGHKSPRFLCLYPFEQLDANAVHLRGMEQVPLFLSCVCQRDGSSMETIMAAFAEGHEIGLLVAPIVTTKNDVMDFSSLVFRLPFALLAGVTISCEDIGACVGKTVVDPLLVEPLLLQDFRVLERMRIKGSCFQDNGCDRQERLDKVYFSHMSVYLAAHGW